MDPQVQKYTCPGMCPIPLTTTIPIDEYTNYTRVTGYRRITVRDMIIHAKEASTYVEINLSPFGINILTPIHTHLAEEASLLATPYNNPQLDTFVREVVDEATHVHNAPQSVLDTIGLIPRAFNRVNRNGNRDYVFFYPATNTIVITVTTYTGPRNSIGMECLKRALALPGVKGITITASTREGLVSIEVSIFIKHTLTHQIELGEKQTVSKVRRHNPIGTRPVRRLQRRPVARVSAEPCPQ